MAARIRNGWVKRAAFITIGLAVAGAAAYPFLLPHMRTAVRARRPLPKGECTWYAFERAREAGWQIRFDVPYDRHARNWPEKVVNGQCGDSPKPGAIMVMDAWPNNPYGHVAYVERVTGPDSWVVTHANFAVGQGYGTRDGVSVYEAECQRTKNGVKLGGLIQPFALRCFLYPAAETERGQ